MSTLDLAVSIRVSAGTQVAVELSERWRTVWVRRAAEIVKNCSFGGHGRGFVGSHLTNGWNDHAAQLRRGHREVEDVDQAASIDGTATARRSS
jgi:hypothetical protein